MKRMPYCLTPKQERVLEYFEQAIKRAGRAPSLRQVAADLGISHTAVAQFIQTLADDETFYAAIS